MPEAMFPAPSIFSMVPVFDSVAFGLEPVGRGEDDRAEGGGGRKLRGDGGDLGP